MDTLEAIILGVVQGITEWLPVSSSAHLVILQTVFGYGNSTVFDIMVHGGTLLAVILYFWRDFIMLLKNFFLTFVDIFKIGRRAFTKDEDRRLTWYIVLATIPIIIVGLLLQDYIDAIFSSLLIVGIALLITGTWLFSTRHAKGGEKLNGRISLYVGLAQATAIIPGISRSGSTISTGMLLGLEKKDAARFSFLLSMPAIGGAFALKVLSTPTGEVLTLPNIAGFISAFVVGILTIHLLLGIIRRGKFYLFAIYCWTLGALVLAYEVLA